MLVILLRIIISTILIRNGLYNMETNCFLIRDCRKTGLLSVKWCVILFHAMMWMLFTWMTIFIHILMPVRIFLTMTVSINMQLLKVFHIHSGVTGAAIT